MEVTGGGDPDVVLEVVVKIVLHLGNALSWLMDILNPVVNALSITRLSVQAG